MHSDNKFHNGDMESGMNLQGAWAEWQKGWCFFWKKDQCIEKKRESHNESQKGWSSRSPDCGRCWVENCTCGWAGEWIIAVFNPREVRAPRPQPTTPINQHDNFPLLGRDGKRNQQEEPMSCWERTALTSTMDCNEGSRCFRTGALVTTWVVELKPWEMENHRWSGRGNDSWIGSQWLPEPIRLIGTVWWKKDPLFFTGKKDNKEYLIMYCC